MDYRPEQAAAVLKMLENCMAKDEPPHEKLKHLWWTLLFARSRALANGLRPYTGGAVAGGPFKGMKLTEEAMGQYYAPIMLGCYEHELHPAVEKIVAANYARILNIGCSVGYYAVGLARRMPQTTIEAFDILPVARERCDALARLNEVQGRVKISGQFYGDDFAKYAEGRTLVLADIEGGEIPLLDPVRYPTLQKMDILVELHDLMDPTISKTMNERFAPTHEIEIIANHDSMPDLTPLLGPDVRLDPFDHLLMGWEGRDGITPWGFYKAKNV